MLQHLQKGYKKYRFEHLFENVTQSAHSCTISTKKNSGHPALMYCAKQI